MKVILQEKILIAARKLINNIEDSKKIWIYNSSWDTRPANLDWNEHGRAEFNVQVGCE